MKWWKSLKNRVMVAFWEMELRRTQKELAVTTANIETKTGNLQLNVERKIRLERFTETIQRELDKLKGGATSDEQESATQAW